MAPCCETTPNREVRSRFVANVRTVFTVHNIAYQGTFPADVMKLTGLPGWLFNPGQLEFHNHLSFLNWFQDARNAYLELVGLPRLSAATPGPVLTRVEARYLKPLAYADRLLVTARTASLRRRSFVMEYAAWRDGCCARGSALCVLMINATGAKTPVPEDVRAAMIRLDAPTVEA